MKTFFKTILVFIASMAAWIFLANSWLEDYVNTLSGFNEIVPFIFIPPVLVSVIYLVKKIKTKTINKKLSDEQVEIKKEDFELLSNRKFQFKFFIGSKITWTFNNDGDVVNIKAGWLGINTVNSDIKIESLGNGNFRGRNYNFSLKKDCIVVSGKVLKELK